MAAKTREIDTSAIKLDASFGELVNVLSEHARDAGEMAELSGDPTDVRTANADREDAASTDDTDSPSSDQRRTVTETLKALCALGYQIVPRAAQPSESDTEQAAESAVQSAVQRLAGGQRVELKQLLTLWQNRNPLHWSRHPQLFRYLAKGLLKIGEPILAYDVALEGHKQNKDDNLLRLLLAQAMLRCGAQAESQTQLRELLDELHKQGTRADKKLLEETLGQLASLYKDRWYRQPNDEDLEEALKLYREAYEVDGGYWPGINVAALSLQRGDRQAAANLARWLYQQCHDALSEATADESDRYWPLATLGEASIILGNLKQAEDWYHKAVAVAGNEYENIRSSRRQAERLIQCIGGDKEFVARCLPLPPVVVFAGHMIDLEHREAPRFPAALEDAVRDEMYEQLEPLGRVIGYSSGACGSDIIFLETVLELGGAIYVVLPYEKDEFCKDSVTIINDAYWKERYERVLKRATQVVTVAPEKISQGGLSYDYANQVLLGLSSVHADRLGTTLTPLAVWDGKKGDGPGGTASIVRRWEERDLKYLHVKIADLLQKHLPNEAAKAARSQAEKSQKRPQPTTDDGTEIIAMLFGDVKGFAKLKEAEYVAFVEHFLGKIAAVIKSLPKDQRPIAQNSWGDAIRLDFKSIEVAGLFALDVLEQLAGEPWAAHRLPEDVGKRLRIGLHAGPVVPCVDPILERKKYTGTHVSRTARIEPVAPPGHVYASQEFAALIRFNGITSFACDYVGQQPLPKGYGTFPTYHVRRQQTPPSGRKPG